MSIISDPFNKFKLIANLIFSLLSIDILQIYLTMVTIYVIIIQIKGSGRGRFYVRRIIFYNIYGGYENGFVNPVV